MDEDDLKLSSEDKKRFNKMVKQHKIIVGNIHSKHREELEQSNARIKHLEETIEELRQENIDQAEQHKQRISGYESANYSLRKKRKIQGLNAYTDFQLEDELAKRESVIIKLKVVRAIHTFINYLKSLYNSFK